MPQKSKHGVFSPTNTFNSKVVSASSRKNKTNRKIRLDRLIRSKNPKILIKRRLGGIGDVLMSTPLLKNIKKVIPNAHITYATDLEYSWGALGEVIKHNPYVDSLISCKEVKGHEYDYSVDITTTGLSVEKPGTVPPNRIDLFADEVGISIDTDPTPDWIVREEEREVAREFINSFLEDKKDREKYKFIMIHCRSNDSRRTWPMDYVDQLADILARNKNSIIFLMDWGCSVDRWKERDRVYPIKGQPIVETAALMEQCDLVICPDSSLLHLAGALNKKTVAIFGPIPAASRINYYANCTAVQLDLPCKNCVTSDSLVRTKTGYKKIENIEVGDYVLTNSGYTEKVKEKHINNRNDRDIVEFDVLGSHKKIEVTDDHEILITKRSYSWKEKDRKEGGRRKIPIFSNPEWIKAKDINVGDYCCYPIPKTTSIESPLLMTEDLAWLVGLFIAEGRTYSAIKKNRGYSVYFSISNKEQVIKNRIESIIKSNTHIFKSI